MSPLGIFRFDQVRHSQLFRCDPSCSHHLGSSPSLAMETSPGGPLAVKPTRGELQACVELLAKKRRSVK